MYYFAANFLYLSFYHNLLVDIRYYGSGNSLFDLITIPGITRLQDIKFSIIFLIHLPLHCILANISLSLKKNIIDIFVHFMGRFW